MIKAVYASLDDVKDQLGISSTDTGDDRRLEQAIDAASRDVDEYCGRYFGRGASETRSYTPEAEREFALPDDVVSLTTLATDDAEDRTWGTTWAATDYDLEPYNAAADNEPYTMVRVTPNGQHEFEPGSQKSVKLVGVFGWPAVPAQVKEATILRAIKLFRRRDAPFSLAGGGEMGQIRMIPGQDPDIDLLLGPLRKEPKRAILDWSSLLAV